MSNDGGNDDDVREFRLEGVTLVVSAAVLVIALGGAFMLGRWVERGRSQPAGSAVASSEDPLTQLGAQVEDPTDVDESADFFDKIEEGSAEADREARRTSADDAGTGRDATATPAVGPGSYFVQVWAGRDRQAAELLVNKLHDEGYAVKIVSDRVEGDTLFKVRVGGYETEAEARRMSGELEGKGYRGAWVTSAS